MTPKECVRRSVKRAWRGQEDVIGEACYVDGGRCVSVGVGVSVCGCVRGAWVSEREKRNSFLDVGKALCQPTGY